MLELFNNYSKSYFLCVITNKAIFTQICFGILKIKKVFLLEFNAILTKFFATSENKIIVSKLLEMYF